MESLNKLNLLVLVGALLLGVTACLPHSLPQINPTATGIPTSTAIPVAVATATKTAIPLTPTPGMPASPIFGVEMDQIDADGGLNLVVAANTTWVRRNAVEWSKVESTEGTYNWEAIADLESELKNASAVGIQVILEVRSTPEWARKKAGTGPTCGPISQTKLPAFGNFMRALVARYNAAPYNVKYWEIWNEPDIDSSYFTSDNIFGCWGDNNDAYFGGGYYAEMLKVIYPQVKAADPQGQVLIGGLLLDCDPRGSPSVCATVHPTVPEADRPPRFLEGILINNGGPYFDGVSFHAYDYYGSGQYANANWQSAWNTTGPVFIAKVHYIKSVFNQYGISGKFLMNTELALLCDTCNNDTLFEATKAYYVAQSYAAAIAQGLRANTWYSVFGWRNSGLLDDELNPYPAYMAYKFGRSELGTVEYIGEITAADIGGDSSVKGYKFRGSDRDIWVLWSYDGNPHLISLVSTPLAAWDALGSPVTPATSMNVTFNPLYLEWNP